MRKDKGKQKVGDQSSSQANRSRAPQRIYQPLGQRGEDKRLTFEDLQEKNLLDPKSIYAEDGFRVYGDNEYEVDDDTQLKITNARQDLHQDFIAEQSQHGITLADAADAFANEYKSEWQNIYVDILTNMHIIRHAGDSVYTYNDTFKYLVDIGTNCLFFGAPISFTINGQEIELNSNLLGHIANTATDLFHDWIEGKIDDIANQGVEEAHYIIRTDTVNDALKQMMDEIYNDDELSDDEKTILIAAVGQAFISEAEKAGVEAPELFMIKLGVDNLIMSQYTSFELIEDLPWTLDLMIWYAQNDPSDAAMDLLSQELQKAYNESNFPVELKLPGGAQEFADTFIRNARKGASAIPSEYTRYLSQRSNVVVQNRDMPAVISPTAQQGYEEQSDRLLDEIDNGEIITTVFDDFFAEDTNQVFERFLQYARENAPDKVDGILENEGLYKFIIESDLKAQRGIADIKKYLTVSIVQNRQLITLINNITKGNVASNNSRGAITKPDDRQNRELWYRGAYKAFGAVSMFGEIIGCEGLVIGGQILQQGVIIAKSFDVLKSLQTLASPAMLEPTAAIFMAAMTIFKLLNKRKQAPSPYSIIYKQMQEISRQIRELYNAMQEQFQQVHESLRRIYFAILEGFDDILKAVGNSHAILVFKLDRIQHQLMIHSQQQREQFMALWRQDLDKQQDLLNSHQRRFNTSAGLPGDIVKTAANTFGIWLLEKTCNKIGNGAYLFDDEEHYSDHMRALLSVNDMQYAHGFMAAVIKIAYQASLHTANYFHVLLWLQIAKQYNLLLCSYPELMIERDPKATELAQIIRSGDRILQFYWSTRNNSNLFEQVLNEYKSALSHVVNLLNRQYREELFNYYKELLKAEIDIEKSGFSVNNFFGQITMGLQGYTNWDSGIVPVIKEFIENYQTQIDNMIKERSKDIEEERFVFAPLSLFAKSQGALLPLRPLLNFLFRKLEIQQLINTLITAEYLGCGRLIFDVKKIKGILNFSHFAGDVAIYKTDDCAVFLVDIKFQSGADVLKILEFELSSSSIQSNDHQALSLAAQFPTLNSGKKDLDITYQAISSSVIDKLFLLSGWLHPHTFEMLHQCNNDVINVILQKIQVAKDAVIHEAASASTGVSLSDNVVDFSGALISLDQHYHVFLLLTRLVGFSDGQCDIFARELYNSFRILTEFDQFGVNPQSAELFMANLMYHLLGYTDKKNIYTGLLDEIDKKDEDVKYYFVAEKFNPEEIIPNYSIDALIDRILYYLGVSTYQANGPHHDRYYLELVRDTMRYYLWRYNVKIDKADLDNLRLHNPTKHADLQACLQQLYRAYAIDTDLSKFSSREMVVWLRNNDHNDEADNLEAILRKAFIEENKEDTQLQELVDKYSRARDIVNGLLTRLAREDDSPTISYTLDNVDNVIVALERNELSEEIIQALKDASQNYKQLHTTYHDYICSSVIKRYLIGMKYEIKLSYGAVCACLRLENALPKFIVWEHSPKEDNSLIPLYTNDGKGYEIHILLNSDFSICQLTKVQPPAQIQLNQTVSNSRSIWTYPKILDYCLGKIGKKSKDELANPIESEIEDLLKDLQKGHPNVNSSKYNPYRMFNESDDEQGPAPSMSSGSSEDDTEDEGVDPSDQINCTIS